MKYISRNMSQFLDNPENKRSKQPKKSNLRDIVNLKSLMDKRK